MLNKIRKILFFATIILFFAIITISIYISKFKFENQLLITPKGIEANGMILEKIDDLKSFLLTFEIISETEIKINNKQREIYLKETNSNFPYVMNYNILNGSFFSKNMQKSKQKYVVLNKTAAFKFFGENNINNIEIFINNERFLIIGVIDDKDKENSNLYIPASISNKTPNTFMVMLDEKITEEYVKSELKYYGITTNKYDFINVSFVTKIIFNKIIMTLYFIILWLVILLSKNCILNLLINIEVFKKLLEKYYFKELIYKKSYNIIKFFVLIIFLLGLIVAFFSVFLNLVNNFLDTTNIPKILWKTYPIGFYKSVLLLQKLLVYSNSLFIVFIIISSLFFISILKK